jgi:CRISPR system Cascade subunit CasC
MFIEFHLLQSFVPSNLNRDDNGYPKSGLFGGARRARISSQCIKHAIRTSDVFKRAIPTQDEGMRTRRMMELLKPSLKEQGKSDEESEIAVKGFTTVYAGLDDKNKDLSSVLVYLSREDIDAMVKAILENWDAILGEVPEKDGKRQYPKDKLKKAKPLQDALKAIAKQTQKRTSAPDIALFGRMLADNPEFAMDAACVVANAASTHAVEEMEVDYFTAMDDNQPKDEPGAAQINLTGFNSACYYRYASLDWNQLRLNLRKQGLTPADADVLRGTVDGLMRALTDVVPSGMKNRFGQNNPPDLVLAVVRTGGPGWSLANAFEKPVRGEDGMMEQSAKRLDRYWNDLTRAYGTQSVKHVAYCVVNSELEPHISYLKGKEDSFEKWRGAVLAALDNEEAKA